MLVQDFSDGRSFKILAPIFLFISLKPLISLGFTFIQQAITIRSLAIMRAQT
ncbi:hypothetical protein [Sphaerospermopsis sp. FACHB-1094]|uniref:hypothetical protein n=1 Tax=Sphaerospermopsis sp. FACHB-1094 TaxID=2692861 RepID=UPI001682726C|nr:hypothetical protein [Sphaerospermopsis sp. FACHB-1094]